MSDALTHNEAEAVAWWRRAAVYQVYIRSFADGDGDGTGDIAGLRARLPYLRELGVDAVWINPWYPSPLRDGGYDVADYRDIDPRFGTLAHADELVAEAHRLGLRIIVDLVPNHTSDEHAWFREALAAPAGSQARNRYIFRPGRGADGALPPNDWASVFGGPAWERSADGEWYLHLFDRSQPDLNWDNPEVRAEVIDILRFWLDRGVDGFRVDVAHGMVKDPALPDHGGIAVPADRRLIVDHPHWDRDGVHDIIRSWRAVLDGYDDRMMVAEAWVSPDRLPLYLRPDEFHQSFNFDLLEAPWSAAAFAAVIEGSYKSAVEVGNTSTWVLSNHDVMRHTTRYGLPPGVDWRRWPMDGPAEALDPARGRRRARAAALVTLALPGSAYIYQGEELGLPEVLDLPDEALDDPTWERSGRTDRGRDGCRVPLPWTAEGPSFGFGAGPSWLPQPAGFALLAAASQEGDPASMLSLYRQALSLRRRHLSGDEELTMLDLGPDVLAFGRGSGLRCVVNMGPGDVALPAGSIVLSSDPAVRPGATLLPADAAVWLLPSS